MYIGLGLVSRSMLDGVEEVDVMLDRSRWYRCNCACKWSIAGDFRFLFVYVLIGFVSSFNLFCTYMYVIIFSLLVGFAT